MAGKTQLFEVWSDSFICVAWLRAWACLSRDVTHLYVLHETFICATCFIHMCDVTDLYVRHASSICAACLIRMCHMWHGSFICATCDMQHGSFICTTSRIHMHRGRKDSYVRQETCHAALMETFICTAGNIHECSVTGTNVRHDPFICVTWRSRTSLAICCLGVMCHTHKHDSFTRVTWLIRMRYNSLICAVTHLCVPWLMHVYHESCICAMTDSYVPWLIHMCHDAYVRVTVPRESFKFAITHAYVCHDSFVCYDSFTKCDMTHSDVPWLIHMCRDLLTRTMTHSSLPRESFRSATISSVVAYTHS